MDGSLAHKLSVDINVGSLRIRTDRNALPASGAAAPSSACVGAALRPVGWSPASGHLFPIVSGGRPFPAKAIGIGSLISKWSDFSRK